MLTALKRRFEGWLSHAPNAERAEPTAGNPTQPPIPQGARSLHEEGVERLNSSQPAEALQRFEAAIALAAEFAEAHYCAGLALRALGRPEEAVTRFERAIAIKHDYVPAINSLGEVHVELRRHEDANDCFKLALAFDAGFVPAHFNLGISHWAQGSLAEAAEHFTKVIELDSRSMEANANLGMIFMQRDMFADALKHYESAVALGAELPELFLNKGLALRQLGRIDEAIGDFTRALVLKPDYAEGLYNLGNAYKEQEKYAQAIECYERVIAINPDHGGAYTNLGHIYKWQGDIERSLDTYRRGLVIKPDDPHVHHNIGYAMSYQDRIAEAIASFERVLELDPEYAETHLNLALTRLRMGDFARGWEAYEWRFRQRNPDNQVVKRKFPCREWNGEPLAGKRLLIWGEQGIGDEILFAGLYQEMIDRAAPAQCLIECVGKLVPLFQRSFPGARTIARTEPMHPAIGEDLDYHVAAGSLGCWLRTSRESFPDRRGYLVADPTRAAHWRQRLAGLGAGLKVGFSWRSSNLKGERALACTQLDQWEPVFRVPGVHFVSLQYGECRRELEEARERFGLALHAYDEIDLFNDLDAAAALTAAVDLVVSAPTSVSVLAAALGVPTWQMSYGPDWQTHGTDRNLWYPAVTRFWRAWNKTWEEVLGGVAAKLAEESGRAARPADGRQR